mgnify:CR=1 FL=1
MELEYYQTFDEKRLHFCSHSIVNTKDDLKSVINKFEQYEEKNKIRYLFRGVNNASYKVYSSAQRLWLYRNLLSVGLTYDQFLINILGEAKREDGIIYNYFKRLGVTVNDWLVFSFLQHYGAATPFVDFSKRYRVSLFFAFDGVNYDGSVGELNDYVSVYYYKTVDVANDVAPSVIRLAEQKAKNKRTYSGGLSIWKKLTFNDIMNENPLIIVPAYSNRTNIKNSSRKTVATYTIANLNAVAQEGEFICNSCDKEPLEDVMAKGTKKYLHCVDIHKGLYEYIVKNILEVSSIEEGRCRYYPDARDISKSIVNRVLENLE